MKASERVQNRPCAGVSKKKKKKKKKDRIIRKLLDVRDLLLQFEKLRTESSRGMLLIWLVARTVILKI